MEREEDGVASSVMHRDNGEGKTDLGRGDAGGGVWVLPCGYGPGGWRRPRRRRLAMSSSSFGRAFAPRRCGVDESSSDHAIAVLGVRSPLVDESEAAADGGTEQRRSDAPSTQSIFRLGLMGKLKLSDPSLLRNKQVPGAAASELPPIDG